ncbi:hypothetical protein SAMN06265375_101219 [Muriicola jejuensis]|uniref:Viral A-type inclusion protein n=1 Tax=Muriicola jejuensis TaxID=504488 RepID=A0A6P0UAB3_9FLAO|nr:hypothetical protein [Muriicola jejuensis]NER10241.1 hypothetical protein [Muriicola jejuensis]SMP01815.1 hypothetical protein SAMN06265375_101219 [Muriicola jejuensis]
MKKTTLVFLSFFLLISACRTENKKEDNSAKMKEVIAVHDEVMPKMSEISKLVARLKPMADSSEAGSPYMVAMKDLQAAHQSMMDWMQGFGARFDSDEILNGKELSEEKKAWLLEEEQKVIRLREDINGSIERARALLSEN